MWGEAESRLWGFRPGPRGPGEAVGTQANPLRCQPRQAMCTQNTDSRRPLISVAVHELNALPAKSRNVCFHDCLSGQRE